MVAYEDEDLIPAPRNVVWRLLQDHLNDAKIVEIHPLIQSQKTVRRSDQEVVVDRRIDVRRKPVPSRWKITYHPPERARWEILESDGPWAPGSHLDLTYEEVRDGTRILARGDLTVRPLPFLTSQERAIRTIFADLRTEDVWYLRRYRY
jgi:hypothetical protein